ncbi:MAG: ABC transporter substrate-binding protein [Oscillospiraceae bacterium]|nr:ABC transporter substrate-binding protein [Oscillospiraceae bacterium]
MKKYIKVISLLLSVAIIATCMVGCGSKSKGGKVTITVPDLVLNSLGSNAYLQQKQEEFNRLYGDEIEVKHILPTTSSDTNDVQNLSAVLISNDAPAFINVSSTIYMKDLYNMGLIRDITDLVKDSETFNKNTKLSIEACKYSDGKIIGYPAAAEVPLLGFYNSALSEAGYNPATFSVKTWDEYYKSVKKMNTSAHKGASLFASEFFLWPNNWILSNGGRIALQNTDGTIKLNYTDSKVVEAIEFLQKLYKEKLTNSNIGYTDIDSMFSSIYNKQVASFTMYPTWLSRFVDSGIEPNQITLSMFPKGPSGEYTNVMYVSSIVFNASLTDEEAKAAIKYVEFMHSEEYYKGYYEFCKNNGVSQFTIPCVEGIDWWSSLTDFPQQWIEVIKTAIKTAEDISLDSTGFSTYISADLPSIITGSGKISDGLAASEKTAIKEWLNTYNKKK